MQRLIAMRLAGAVGAICASAYAAAAYADNAAPSDAPSVYVSPMIQYGLKDNDPEVKDNFGYQVGIGFNLPHEWALEGDFSRGEVADERRGPQAIEKGVDRCAGGFGEQVGQKDAGVEIGAQPASSSYMACRSSTDVMGSGARVSRPARNRSRLRAAIPTSFGPLSIVARNSATGLPWRVMTTASPAIALSMRLGRLFFAVATL